MYCICMLIINIKNEIPSQTLEIQNRQFNMAILKNIKSLRIL